ATCRCPAGRRPAGGTRCAGHSSDRRRAAGPARRSGPERHLRTRLHSGKTEVAHAGQTLTAAEPARDRAELLLLELLRVARRVPHSRDDQVGQRLDVVGVHDLGVDVELLELELTAHRGGDHATARGAGDLGLRDLLLRLEHLLLHLLGLLQDLLHVGHSAAGLHHGGRSDLVAGVAVSVSLVAPSVATWMPCEVRGAPKRQSHHAGARAGRCAAWSRWSARVCCWRRAPRQTRLPASPAARARRPRTGRNARLPLARTHPSWSSTPGTTAATAPIWT